MRTARAALGAAVAVAALAAVVVAGLAVARGQAGREAASDRAPAVVPVATGEAIEVRAARRSTTEVPATPVVDGLPSPAVLLLRVTGFEEFTHATARQCRGAAEAVRCGNDLRVVFGRYGLAEFQYLVRADAGLTEDTEGPWTGCGVADPICVVRVTSADGRHRAEVQTVFGGTLPPPGAIEVTPSRGLQEGQAVTVTLRGLPPGGRARVTTCAAAATPDPGRCGSPAPSVEVVVGADGTARTEVSVTRGPIGSQLHGCDDRACAVVVLGEEAGVRAPPAAITFGRLPGAVYDPWRLGAGLAVAVALGSLATWLVRRTDWSAVGEAAAPEIDEAEYADLDAIVAALPDDVADLATDP